MSKNNFKKIDFSKNLSKKTGYSLVFSKKIHKDLIDILQNQIKNNLLVLKNIGKFKLIEKKERIGRNPKNKKEYIIEKRKSISFIASKNILKKINII